LSGRVVVEAAGLLFDNDGVIVSSIASVNRCWRRWAKHYGVPNADEFEIEHGTRAVDVMKALVPGIDVAEGLKLIEDMELEDVADLEVLPGVKALLESLPRERWAIVSSATYRLLVGRLQVAKLPVPENIVAGDRVVHGKPHPEPYLRGAEMIHAAAKDCVVIEDAPSGVQAGLAAGCRVLGVMGTHTEAELRAAGVDWVVASLEDVKAEEIVGGVRLVMETV
jgi:sugar-phosphatase